MFSLIPEFRLNAPRIMHAGSHTTSSLDFKSPLRESHWQSRVLRNDRHSTCKMGGIHSLSGQLAQLRALTGGSDGKSDFAHSVRISVSKLDFCYSYRDLLEQRDCGCTY